MSGQMDRTRRQRGVTQPVDPRQHPEAVDVRSPLPEEAGGGQFAPAETVFGQKKRLVVKAEQIVPERRIAETAPVRHRQTHQRNCSDAKRGQIAEPPGDDAPEPV